MNVRLLVLLLFATQACSDADPRALTDSGSKALDSGDHAAAAKNYAAALEAIGADTQHPEWLRAQLGSIRARIHIDPGAAAEDFLALARAHSSKITPDHFNVIGGRLGDAGRLTEASAVLEAGLQAHPESPHLLALRNELGKRAEASGDAGALEALKGLGYVGD